MKKLLFIVCCGLMLLFDACSKKSSSPPTLYTRVGSVYDDSSHLITNYYYSPGNLLSGDYDDSGRYAYSYHYLPSQSVEQIYLNNGASSYTVLYFWNDKSLVDSSIVQNTNLNQVIAKKYTYDNNNFLTGVNWYNYQNALILTENYTITNNNVTQHNYTILETSNTSLPTGSYNYTYSGNLTNTLGNNYYGQEYLGASSKNPPASCTYTNASGSTTVNYRYNYSGGRIVSELIYVDSSGANGVRIDSLSFGYYN